MPAAALPWSHWPGWRVLGCKLSKLWLKYLSSDRATDSPDSSIADAAPMVASDGLVVAMCRLTDSFRTSPVAMCRLTDSGSAA